MNPNPQPHEVMENKISISLFGKAQAQHFWFIGLDLCYKSKNCEKYAGH